MIKYKKSSIAAKKRWKNKAYREMQRLINLRPDVHKRRSEAAKEIGRRQESKKKKSESLIAAWKRPKVRKKHEIANKKPLVILCKSISRKKVWENVEARKNIMDGMHIANKRPEVRKRKSDAATKHLSKHNGPWKNTGIELIIKKILRKLKLKFKHNKVRIGNHLIDFCDIKNKIIIECDGDYPHANPKFYKAHNIIFGGYAKNRWIRDKQNNKIFKKSGYKVLRLWGYDINNNIEKCIKKIKKIMK